MTEGEAVAYEMLVGLEVVDETAYASYREAMTPILQRYGGGFGCDFRVGEVLLAPAEAPINRVFTIAFPDLAAKEGFFADAAYLAVKRQWFEGAVASTTILGAWGDQDRP